MEIDGWGTPTGDRFRNPLQASWVVRLDPGAATETANLSFFCAVAIGRKSSWWRRYVLWWSSRTRDDLLDSHPISTTPRAAKLARPGMNLYHPRTPVVLWSFVFSPARQR